MTILYRLVNFLAALGFSLTAFQAYSILKSGKTPADVIAIFKSYIPSDQFALFGAIILLVYIVTELASLFEYKVFWRFRQ